MVMEFNDFVTKWATSLDEVIEDQRPGQWAMNLLGVFRPDLYEEIMQRDISTPGVDPYYVDRNLPAFWVVLSELWEA